MITFPNAIAGILIGIANHSWLFCTFAPFAWGVVFCLYKSIAEPQLEGASYANPELRGEKTKWGMSRRQAFYFNAYTTAISTSLLFSIVTGIIRQLFWNS